MANGRQRGVGGGYDGTRRNGWGGLLVWLCRSWRMLMFRLTEWEQEESTHDIVVESEVWNGSAQVLQDWLTIYLAKSSWFWGTCMKLRPLRLRFETGVHCRPPPSAVLDFQSTAASGQSNHRQWALALLSRSWPQSPQPFSQTRCHLQVTWNARAFWGVSMDTFYIHLSDPNRCSLLKAKHQAKHQVQLKLV